MTFDDIEDLKVDENFEVFVGPRGDIAGAKGRDAFEQAIRKQMTDRYVDIIGDIDPDSVLERTELEARRVARDMGRLDEVAAFDAEFSDEQQNAVDITVIFDTGEILDLTIEE